MIEGSSTTVLAVFLIFCRVGTCMMVAPGYSRANIPFQVRLFLAVTVTLMLSPLLEPILRPVVEGAAPSAAIRLIGSELLVGLVIGLSARMFFAALETMATFIASAIGLSLPGIVDDGEHVPSLVPLITLSATVLFFLTDQHWELLRGLIGSYRAWQPAAGFSSEDGLGQIVERLGQAFTLALRIASPFVLYSIIVNLAVGLANKLTPSIPVYFISLPLVLIGGLTLLYLSSREMLLQFAIAFAASLTD
ncbi:flagellar biosynthesis protein FliR [Rhodopseudomonas sp. NSM]|uniref:flagellar biosynthesis protein FliR n=1 Tax=Rhodopseudomonas sp. NSM TaxID=3457630 RepID=UPI0040358F34